MMYQRPRLGVFLSVPLFYFDHFYFICTPLLHFTNHRSYILFQAYADALLVIPKILAQNSGYDPQETIVKLQVIKVTQKTIHNLSFSVKGCLWQLFNTCVKCYCGCKAIWNCPAHIFPHYSLAPRAELFKNRFTLTED